MRKKHSKEKPLENLERYSNRRVYMKKIGFFLMGLSCGIIIVILAGFVVEGVTENNLRFRWGGETAPERKLAEIYNFLNANSMAEFDISEMLEEMYRAFVGATDDQYTRYMNRDEVTAFNTRFDATFVGVGIRVLFDFETNTTNITSVIRGTPAEAAGLSPGDRIIEVDGISMLGRNQDEVIPYVLGAEGEPVNITVYRPSENDLIDFIIYRARIIVPSVYHSMLDNGIGYIRLDGFDRGTERMMLSAIEEFRDLGLQGLILDVRNNPGGLLDVAIDITSHFVPSGVITFTEDANNERMYYRRSGEYLGLPLVVLVNEFSASASELLGGAIQDAETGIIVGVQTFGKASVQTMHTLQDGSGVMTTIARYFTPLGRAIDGVGLAPDHIVELDEYYTLRLERIEFYQDLQLQYAIDLLIDMM